VKSPNPNEPTLSRLDAYFVRFQELAQVWAINRSLLPGPSLWNKLYFSTYVILN